MTKRVIELVPLGIHGVLSSSSVVATTKTTVMIRHSVQVVNRGTSWINVKNMAGEVQVFNREIDICVQFVTEVTGDKKRERERERD